MPVSLIFTGLELARLAESFVQLPANSEVILIQLHLFGNWSHEIIDLYCCLFFEGKCLICFMDNIKMYTIMIE